MLLFLFVGGAQSPAPQVHQHRRCSYSFEYPQNWQVVKNPDYVADECVTTLRPADYDKRMAVSDVDVFTLTIGISETGFLQTAAENGFDFDGHWVVMGRLGSFDPAQIGNTGGWLILRGAARVSCFHKDGGNAGLCDENRVIAKHRDEDRVVVIVGGPQTQAALDVILKSVKLLPR